MNRVYDRAIFLSAGKHSFDTNNTTEKRRSKDGVEEARWEQVGSIGRTRWLNDVKPGI